MSHKNEMPPSAPAVNASTPMMGQFFAVKEKYPDALLFFRMGDFYEMFGEDAQIASKILGIALTSRNKQAENQVPMCGVPHHTYKSYAVKLVKAGYNVAVCDQLENPAEAKGLVKRGVTRVITPATMIDAEELLDSENNFLLSIYQDPEDGGYFVAAADVSTGETYITATAEEGLDVVIGSFSPKEILSATPLRVDRNIALRTSKSLKESSLSVCERYKVKDASQLGVDDKRLFIPLEMIFCYVDDKLLQVSFARPAVIADKDRLIVDHVASRTLELVQSSSEKGLSLFHVLNYTSTPMGSRTLKRWILTPSRDLCLINRRLAILDYFVRQWRVSQSLAALLESVHDIERIINRIASKRVQPKELVYLKNSLKELPRVRDILEGTGVTEVAELGSSFSECDRIVSVIEQAICDDPPAVLSAGGIIRDGYSQKVDHERRIMHSSTSMLAAKEAELKQSTGIHQLKISFNKVFGYYIEVSKSNVGKVPDYFERKQTLTNAERYVTADIKELENAILNAESNLYAHEYEIFCSIRDHIAESVDLLRDVSKDVAALDVYLSLANAAIVRGYSRPHVDDSSVIEVTGGRHPMVEASLEEIYMANDALLNNADDRLLLVTGPNMAGKSTYIRSVALVTLMAHMGSFVPAESAHIGLVDRIFTRVGASDNIAYGQSTFMVEMVETANILTHATEQSLIILDEIGRGTSTYDGLSIAWAVSEYVLNRVRAKTLFATHYHELTEIARITSGAKNYTILVKEQGGEVLFMHKIVPGAADKSYGIYVAQLAGLPKEVIKRAESVLAELEEQDDSAKAVSPKHIAMPIQVQQILVFDEHPAIDRIKQLDLNHITPMDAFKMLGELKESVDKT